jgi:hypothetical protein
VNRHLPSIHGIHKVWEHFYEQTKQLRTGRVALLDTVAAREGCAQLAIDLRLQEHAGIGLLQGSQHGALDPALPQPLPQFGVRHRVKGLGKVYLADKQWPRAGSTAGTFRKGVPRHEVTHDELVVVRTQPTHEAGLGWVTHARGGPPPFLEAGRKDGHVKLSKDTPNSNTAVIGALKRVAFLVDGGPRARLELSRKALPREHAVKKGCQARPEDKVAGLVPHPLITGAAPRFAGGTVRASRFTECDTAKGQLDFN